MSKDAYMNLNIRVCGAETLTLANSARKFYINGIVTEEASSLTDSQRYESIPESTFATWFNLGPSNDPCEVNSY